ncbi:unnamed protein product, partial [Phaeothamnion confervicola]
IPVGKRRATNSLTRALRVRFRLSFLKIESWGASQCERATLLQKCSLCIGLLVQEPNECILLFPPYECILLFPPFRCRVNVTAFSIGRRSALSDPTCPDLE